MSARKLISFLFISCFAAIGASADISLYKILQKQDKYKNRDIYFDHESQTNSSLLYMFCDRSPQNMTCTIFREEHYIDKLPRISPCNVTLKVEDPYTHIGKIIRLLPLSPSKALILWVGLGDYGTGPFGFGEAYILKYTIVDFDICRITEVTLKTEVVPSLTSIMPLIYPDGETAVRSAGFAFYDDSCDIFFRDLQCGVGFCKVRIDKNTGMVTSRTDFGYTQGPDVIDIVPKKPKNPREGNFFFDWKDGVIYVFEEHKGLVHFPNDVHSKDDWQKFRYSVQGNFVTVCKEIEETKIKCDQIDFNGQIRIHVNLDLQKKNLAPVPYTLPHGEFLLLTTECVSNCTKGATNHVYKVDVDGKLKEITEIESLDCDINEFVHWNKFFRNEEGNVCVSLLCYDSEKKYPVDIWKYPFGHKTVDLDTNSPEKFLVKCLNLSKL